MLTGFTDIENGFAPVNDASLYYEKMGSGPAIVFIHGFGLDCRMWDEQFLFFSKQFQVIRYDLRGFGKSSLPEDKPYAHHDDLHELLSYLHISKAVLIGLSMGGRVVVDFALTFPSMTTSIVLVDAALNGYTFKTFSLESIYSLAKEHGTEKANAAWQKHELFDAANKNMQVSRAISNMTASYSGWHWVNKNPLKPLVPPSMQQLDQIKTPALIIVGESDLPDFHAIADILSQNISGSQKKIIAGGGHMCNMEKPDAFNKLVLDFLLAVQ